MTSWWMGVWDFSHHLWDHRSMVLFWLLRKSWPGPKTALKRHTRTALSSGTQRPTVCAPDSLSRKSMKTVATWMVTSTSHWTVLFRTVSSRVSAGIDHTIIISVWGLERLRYVMRYEAEVCCCVVRVQCCGCQVVNSQWLEGQQHWMSRTVYCFPPNLQKYSKESPKTKTNQNENFSKSKKIQKFSIWEKGTKMRKTRICQHPSRDTCKEKKLAKKKKYFVKIILRPFALKSKQNTSGEGHGAGYEVFPHKLRTGQWQLFGGTQAFTHQSLPLDRTALNNRVFRSRNSTFFEILYFQEFCLSRPRHFFQKSTKNHHKKFAGLRPAPPLSGAALLPPTMVDAKCLAAVVLDNQDRALRCQAKGLQRGMTKAKQSLTKEKEESQQKKKEQNREQNCAKTKIVWRGSVLRANKKYDGARSKRRQTTKTRKLLAVLMGCDTMLCMHVNFCTRSRLYQREACRPSSPGREFLRIFGSLLNPCRSASFGATNKSSGARRRRDRAAWSRPTAGFFSKTLSFNFCRVGTRP